MKIERWCFEEMEKQVEWDSGLEKTETWVLKATIIRTYEVIWRKFATVWFWFVINSCKWDWFLLLLVTIVICTKSYFSAVLCHVTDVILDFGVLFCFNVFSKVFFSRVMSFRSLFFIKLLFAFISINTFLCNISEDEFFINDQ